VLHRLSINRTSNSNEKIRITFLSRNTKYRNVLNENELITALKNNSEYEVKKVYFFKMQMCTMYKLNKKSVIYLIYINNLIFF